MNFVSKFALFAPLSFTVYPTATEVTGIVTAVIAGEVGPNAYGIFYLVETVTGETYEVEEASMAGELKGGIEYARAALIAALTARYDAVTALAEIDATDADVVELLALKAEIDALKK